MTKARVNADNASADIQGVTAGTGLTGGGTTGTVTLTNGMATAIDAKGDLVVGTGADTFSRLAAGSNGETIVADSSTSTGLRWQAPVAANPFLNSAFQVWQRGTSFAFNNSVGYTADRWYGSVANTAATISRQLTNDTTNLPFIQYCARLARNSGSTSTGAITFQQSMETINSIPYAGKTVTFSFYARAGANFSASSNLLAVYLITGTGTDQNQSVGYTGQATPVNSGATLTTTWQRFTYTGTIATTATEIAAAFTFTPTGTAGANDWYEITGLQLEVGSVATPFKTYAGTIQGELAACQRYYYRIDNETTNGYPGLSGVASTATLATFQVLPKSTMRIKPTSVDFSSLRAYDLVNAAQTISAITISNGSGNGWSIDVTSSSMSQYRTYVLLANTLPSYLGFSAEL